LYNTFLFSYRENRLKTIYLFRANDAVEIEPKKQQPPHHYLPVEDIRNQTPGRQPEGGCFGIFGMGGKETIKLF